MNTTKPSLYVQRLLLVLSLLLIAADSRAQQRGIAADQLNPSERGSEWFASDSLDLRGNLRPALGLVGAWSYRSLVARDDQNDIERSVVRNQFVVHVGASLVLVERLRLAVNFPIQAYADGRGATVGARSFAPPASKSSIGDLRVAADVRLFGQYGDPITLAAGLGLALPTGDRDSYAGDGVTRIIPQVLVAGDIGQFVYSARLGVGIRPKSTAFADTYAGSYLSLALAAGARVLDGRLVVGPELFTNAVFVKDQFFEKNSTPAEVLFGAHYTLPAGVRLGAGFGVGLTTSFRAPQHRGLLNVEWAPGIDAPPPPAPPPPADRDLDGVPDDADACPDQAGDPQLKGCPAPKDRDGDGVNDAQDACPDEPGLGEHNGCPPPDADRDGILDSQDACPQQVGPSNQDPAKNGCPPPADRDEDGVVDEQDACPGDAGPADPDPKRNGCPKAFVQDNQIKILDQVKFQSGQATIVPGKESEEVLLAVLQVLKDHPEVQQVAIQGHTDNTGSSSLNRALSDQRAQTVRTWLSAHGIDASRLTSVGLGPDRPIAPNDTEEGRRLNRRVEFHIQGAAGTPPQ